MALPWLRQTFVNQIDAKQNTLCKNIRTNSPKIWAALRYQPLTTDKSNPPYGVHWQQTSTYYTLHSRSNITPWYQAWPPKSIRWSNIIPNDAFAVLSCNNVKPKPYSSVGANHNKRSIGMSTHWNPSITHNHWPTTHKRGSLYMPLRIGWVN